ncbi:hypothetical protein GCM10010320_80780 [Streptomyces caelestis]|nr:hypothetical protein GCM10010320_80780 [Streptomyces caelestis]
MIGTITLLDRRDAERPGHVRPESGEAELGYMFLPEAWGCGYAAEACAAALDWFADALPGEPVVLCTQTANDRAMRLAAKLGFTEVERFEEWGAEQWSAYGLRSHRSAELVPHQATCALVTIQRRRSSAARGLQMDATSSPSATRPHSTSPPSSSVRDADQRDRT